MNNIKSIDFDFGNDKVHILPDSIKIVNGEERIPIFYTVDGITRGNMMRTRFLELSKEEQEQDVFKCVEYYRTVNKRINDKL